MNIGFELGDVADAHFAPGRWGQLHDADRTGAAAPSLIELRLLVSLRRHQQPIDIVLTAKLLKQLDHAVEAG